MWPRRRNGLFPFISFIHEFYRIFSLTFSQIGWRVSLVNSQSSCISVEPFCCLILPLSKHHWITSAIYLSLDSLQQHSYQDPFPSISDPSVHVEESIGCIVCGDRKGSVFLYITDPSKEHKTLNVSDELQDCPHYK